MQRPCVPAVLAFVLGLAAGAGGADARDVPAKAAEAEPSASQQAIVKQMAEAQKWVGEQVWHIRERLDALPGLIAETKEGDAAALEEIAKLRDEVKGLYVEISDVKEKIEALKTDIGGVDTNVYRFRTYAGFFLALMLLMVALIFVMTIRR